MKRFEAEVGSVDTYDNPIEYGHAPIIARSQSRRIRADAEPPTYLPHGPRFAVSSPLSSFRTLTDSTAASLSSAISRSLAQSAAAVGSTTGAAGASRRKQRH